MSKEHPAWDQIKKSILFQFQGDWKSIFIPNHHPKNHSQLRKIISQHYRLNPPNEHGVESFFLNGIRVYIYKDSSFQFDFDPIEVMSMDQWLGVIKFLKTLSSELSTPIQIIQESYGEDVLVIVDGDEVVYDFKVHDAHYK